jgi:hypothetical protein
VNSFEVYAVFFSLTILCIFIFFLIDMPHPEVGKLKYVVYWFGRRFELNALIDGAQWGLNVRIMVGIIYV